MSTPLKQLGPYEIISPLGSGGMGDVYRAKDTRLGRDVALKILRGDVASDADRRARFEREARTVAALSHPNIVALFEVGNADGVEFTASELVDGESLRALLTREGALPVRRVVELATQLADGMAAAHAAGIVHRDLKPENVMLTKDGRVKILDFGLARQVGMNFGSGSGATSSAETMIAQPTIISSAPSQYMTSPGMVLGTAAYMSPEQARGQEADYRSDQFSFGVIVYEMLAGKQPFARDSAVETMSAIIRDEPEPLDQKIPVTLRWVVQRCLEKDPGQRFDSSKDLYQQLRMLRDHFSEALSNSSSIAALHPELAALAPNTRKPAAWLWTVALLIGLAIGAASVWLLKPTGVDLTRQRFTPFAMNAGHPLWSPDGKSAVYSGEVGDGYELFLRAVNSATPQQLTHAGGDAFAVSWSPDSSHIFFLQILPGADVMRVLSVATVGGDPEVVWTVGNGFLPRTISISPDGKVGAMLTQGKDGRFDIYISNPIGSALQRYPASGISSNTIFNAPQMAFSPDGKKLLLIRAGESGNEESWLLPWPAGTGKPRQVLKTLSHEGGTPPFAWMPDSRHIVASVVVDSLSSAHLSFADTESNNVTQITQGLDSQTAPSISPDGKSLLFLSTRNDFDIVAMNISDGSTQPLIATPRQESLPAWAAKSDALVYLSDRLGPEDIWLRTKDGLDRPIVTRDMFKDAKPKWLFGATLSPDGSRVIFVAITNGVSGLWEASTSGGAPVPLIDPALHTTCFTGAWSPDGARFAYLAVEKDGSASLNIVKTSGSATPQTLETKVSDSVPTWSLDDKWISYATEEDHWHLISPDGKQHRDLGAIKTPNLGFTADSKTAYGIRSDQGKSTLFSLDLTKDRATLKDIKQLDSSLSPATHLGPAMRFTLAPDGKTLAYSIVKRNNSVWMLTGWN